MKKPVINTQNINLFHLKIIESDIVSQASDIDNINFKINVAHTTMHNLESERIKIGLIIDIIGEIEEVETKTKAHFNIDFHYQVNGLKDFYTVEKNEEPVFSGLLIATLLGVSFSTARGLIYERLNDTDLEGVLLPIVAPQKLLDSKQE